MRKIKKIGIFGFGNMGRAIFELLQSRGDFNLFIYSNQYGKVKKIHYVDSLEELLETCDLIFICIKPQDFKKLLFKHKELKMKSKNKIVVSIMAGIKLNRIKNFFKNCRVVRVMPNLNMVLGKGVVGWHTKKSDFSVPELKEIRILFSRFGKIFFVSGQDKLDAITALAGSGPAYVALFMNALIKAGVKTGLGKNQTKQMVFETLKGTVEYLEKHKIDPEIFIKKIISKGGTTQAALDELDEHKFQKSWQKAIKAAVKRAEELSF